MRGVELPSTDEFPVGPRRILLEALHELYRSADSPGVRTISEGITVGDYRATMNRDLIAKVLNGTRWPSAWQLDSLVRWLATRAIGARDPDSEAARFLGLYQHAGAVGDATVRMADPLGSSVQIFQPRPPYRDVGPSLCMGVLLTADTILTHADLVFDLRLSSKFLQENPQATIEDFRERFVRFPGSDQELRTAEVDWWDRDRGNRRRGSGFATLRMQTPAVGVSPARWASPSYNARVRIFGVDYDDFGIWAHGTITGRHGDFWQLDVGNPLPLRNFGGAGVLDASGRVIGLLTREANSGIHVMTSADAIAAQVPSFRGELT